MSGFPVSGARRSTSGTEPAGGTGARGFPQTLPKSTGMRQAAPHWAGRVPVILVVGIVVYAAVRGVSWVLDWPSVALLITNADHAIYMAQAERILAGGPFYPPDQLAGPFGAERLPELYPPTTVSGLLWPAARLPAFLWWLVPLAVTTAVVVAHRPSPWGWVAILSLLVLYPHTWTIIAAGNPMLWATMGIALGTRYGWPALLALVKPDLWVVPFALVGIRSRLWWLGLAVGVGSVLLTLPLWRDYLTVLRNYTDAAPLSLAYLPMALIPIVSGVLDAQRRAQRSGGVLEGREAHGVLIPVEVFEADREPQRGLRGVQ
jgi:hypothetical protein